jgi:hypothetical protein
MGMILSKLEHTYKNCMRLQIWIWYMWWKSHTHNNSYQRVETNSWLRQKSLIHRFVSANKTESWAWYHQNLRIHIENLYSLTAHDLDSYNEPKRHNGHPIPICDIQPYLYRETKSVNRWDLWFVSIKGTKDDTGSKERGRQKHALIWRVTSATRSADSNVVQISHLSESSYGGAFCWWCSPTDSHLLARLPTQQRPDDFGVPAAWQWCSAHFISAAGRLCREQGGGAAETRVGDEREQGIGAAARREQQGEKMIGRVGQQMIRRMEWEQQRWAAKDWESERDESSSVGQQRIERAIGMRAAVLDSKWLREWNEWSRDAEQLLPWSV